MFWLVFVCCVCYDCVLCVFVCLGFCECSLIVYLYILFLVGLLMCRFVSGCCVVMLCVCLAVFVVALCLLLSCVSNCV